MNLELDSDGVKKLIFDCLKTRTFDKLIPILQNLFHLIDDHYYRMDYGMGVPNDIYIAIKDILKKNGYSKYQILDFILSNPNLNTIHDDILYSVVTFDKEKFKTIVKKHHGKLKGGEFFKLIVEQNDTIKAKFMLENYNANPVKYDTLEEFASFSNIKMVRYLAKRKDIQKNVKLSEQEIIKKYAY